MIRDATYDDIPRLVEMAQQFHALSPYSQVADFDGRSFAASVSRWLDSQAWAVKVLDMEQPVGMIIGVAQSFYFAAVHVTVQELIWWVDPAHRGGGLCLLESFENWARSMGAESITMGDVPGLRSLSAVYRRRGYVAADNLYIRRL